MNLFRSIIVSVFTLLSVFTTQPASKPVSTDTQVLGETTNQSVIWQNAVSRALGCDYATTCRDFCAKPENRQHCYEVYNSLYITIMPTRSASSSSSSYSSRSAAYFTKPTATPSVYPTMTVDQRQRFIREIKTQLGCDYETTCRDVCGKPEYKQHCYDVINSLYSTIIGTKYAASSRASSSSSVTRPTPTAYPTTTVQQSSQRYMMIQQVKAALGCDYETTCRDFCYKPENQQRCYEFFSHLNSSQSSSQQKSSTARTPIPTTAAGISSSRSQTIQISSTAMPHIKAEFQQAYQKIMAAGGAERDSQLKALQQEYLRVMSRSQDQAKASTAAVLRNVEEKKLSVTQQETQFRQHLTQIKDTTKRQVVETINAKIVSINEKAISTMNTALDKLSALLGNLNKQLFAMPLNTPDLSAVETEAIDAQSAITEAQTVILAQSTKTYPLTFSSDEAKLKSSISPVIEQLTADLRLAHQAVVKARDAVTKVYTDTNRIKTQTTSSK